MINVAATWRHTIKSPERETPDDVILVARQTSQWDRSDTDTRNLPGQYAHLEQIGCAPHLPVDAARCLEEVARFCPPDGWNPQCFGGYATVRHSARVTCNDKVEVA